MQMELQDGRYMKSHAKTRRKLLAGIPHTITGCESNELKGCESFEVAGMLVVLHAVFGYRLEVI